MPRPNRGPHPRHAGSLDEASHVVLPTASQHIVQERTGVHDYDSDAERCVDGSDRIQGVLQR